MCCFTSGSNYQQSGQYMPYRNDFQHLFLNPIPLQPQHMFQHGQIDEIDDKMENA